ncbi:MAG: NPCBM/NEW2 domain-containing protein, partial [Candidatus Limnocylindrales bacterium]
LHPTSPLAAGTTYTATLKGGSAGIKDLSGTPLAADVSWSFSTAASLTATQVRVETAADGSGTVVPAQSLVSGTSLTVYAISRDASGTFVANVAATWSLSGISGGVIASDLVPSVDTKSATFTGHATGSAVIHAVSGGLTPVDSGAITVTAALPSTWVSDIGWTTMTNGWGPAEIDMSNGEQLAGDGRPITLHGTVYPKGLGVHAASDLTYTLAGMCASFSSDIGIDSEVYPNGSVIFQVFADGTKVYDSGIVTATTPTITVNVNLSGVKVLDLVVVQGTTMAYDHADWAGARVSCPAPASPLSVTAKSPAAGATGVSTASDVTATFSVPLIARTTLSGATVILLAAGSSTPVAATVTYDPPSQTVRLHPTSPLAAGTTYTATLKGGSAGIKDLSGTPLAADVSWSFST